MRHNQLATWLHFENFLLGPMQTVGLNKKIGAIRLIAMITNIVKISSVVILVIVSVLLFVFLIVSHSKRGS
jgi:hypothetical protein